MMDMKAVMISGFIEKIEEEIGGKTSVDWEWLKNRISSVLSQPVCVSLGMGKEDSVKLARYFRQRYNITIADSRMIVENERAGDWFDKDKLNRFWPRFKTYLLKRKKMPLAVVEQVDNDTNKVIAQMGNPSLEHFNKRGLVVGDVQSGKTMNYSALINKASDIGYRLIIVLTGTTEKLRRQTQERLDTDFVGVPSQSQSGEVSIDNEKIGVGRVPLGDPKADPLVVLCLTDAQSDFKNPRRVLLQGDTRPMLVVAKKNVSTLKKISNWLKSQSGELSDVPLLMIDDEADNASVNTGKEDARPRAVNRNIRKILSYFPKSCYVGYTATPFANIFIHPNNDYDSSDLEDLFPKDFILSLTTPDNYCGVNFFFPEAGNHVVNGFEEYVESSPKAYENIRIIKDLASTFDKNYSGQFPDSLREALNEFFIVAALKDYRRSLGVLPNEKTEDRIDSCLINVSPLNHVQEQLKEVVEDYVASLYRGLRNKNPQILMEFEELYQSQFQHLTFQENLEPIEWEDFYSNFLQKIDRPEVLSINSRSEDKQDFDVEDTTKFIVIGGYTLSRGVTLYGLTVSYLARNTRAIDTLMQLGRWFGYRDGYEDLLRLWCDRGTKQAFIGAAETINALQDDILDMGAKKMTPRQYGMRIYCTAGLMPTTRNKMKSAEEHIIELSLDGKKPETYCFHTDEQIEKDNQEVVVNFTRKILASNALKYLAHSNGVKLPFIESVDASVVLDFIKTYKIHVRNEKARMGEKLFTSYLEAISKDSNRTWDVLFYTKEENTHGISDELTQLLGTDIYFQPRSIFGNAWEDGDRDESCVYLSNNRTVTAGSAQGFIRQTDRPTLLIQCLMAGKVKNISGEIPEFLKKIEGKVFYGIKVYFPAFTNVSKTTKVHATQDYIDKMRQQALDLDLPCDEEE